MIKWLKYQWRQHQLTKMDVCPQCKKIVKPRWKQDYLKDPSQKITEPYLFGHYYCIKCGYEAKIIETDFSIQVGKNLGYKNVSDFFGCNTPQEVIDKMRQKNKTRE